VIFGCLFKNRNDKNEFHRDPMVSCSHPIIELSRLINVENAGTEERDQRISKT